MNPVKSKKYDFDITVTDNTYAGELALPYVTAAVTGAETILNNRCRLIEGVVNKAVISNLGLSDVIQAADCAGTDGADLSLTEQIVTLKRLDWSRRSFAGRRCSQRGWPLKAVCAATETFLLHSLSLSCHLLRLRLDRTLRRSCGQVTQPPFGAWVSCLTTE